jgi:hypothetical protein
VHHERSELACFLVSGLDHRACAHEQGEREKQQPGAENQRSAVVHDEPPHQATSPQRRSNANRRPDPDPSLQAPHSGNQRDQEEGQSNRGLFRRLERILPLGSLRVGFLIWPERRSTSEA